MLFRNAALQQEPDEEPAEPLALVLVSAASPPTLSEVRGAGTAACGLVSGPSNLADQS